MAKVRTFQYLIAYELSVVIDIYKYDGRKDGRKCMANAITNFDFSNLFKLNPIIGERTDRRK